jgi:hypothetical protein
MNTSRSTVLAASTGLAILVFTILSSAFAGLEAVTTLSGIGALVVWGTLAVGLSDAAPTHRVRARPVPIRRVSSARVPAVVEFPAFACSRRAA